MSSKFGQVKESVKSFWENVTFNVDLEAAEDFLINERPVKARDVAIMQEIFSQAVMYVKMQTCKHTHRTEHDTDMEGGFCVECQDCGMSWSGRF